MEFECLQVIVQKHPSEYQEDNSLIWEFKELAAIVFIFVDSWDAPEIDPDTCHLCSRRKPANAATALYIQHVHSKIMSDSLIEHQFLDLCKCG